MLILNSGGRCENETNVQQSIIRNTRSEKNENRLTFATQTITLLEMAVASLQPLFTFEIAWNITEAMHFKWDSDAIIFRQ